ncbi:MAG: hypothetical protein AB7F28_05680 [Candidatus Margulisiibacteriota bacterium]
MFTSREKPPKNVKTEVGKLLELQPYRRRGMLWFLLAYVPLAVLCVVFKLLQLLVSGKTKARLSVAYLKVYFRVFFYFRGIYSYAPLGWLPEDAAKPKIILTTRTDFYAPWITWLRLAQQVVVPIHPLLKDFPVHPLIPFPKVGSFFSAISYEDADLDLSMDNIKALLGAGYSVVVYINKGYATPRTSDTLFIFKEIIELLNIAEYPLYFLDQNDMGSQKFASQRIPIMARVGLDSSRQVLMDLPGDTDGAVFERIASYFKFSYYRII